MMIIKGHVISSLQLPTCNVHIVITIIKLHIVALSLQNKLTKLTFLGIYFS